MPARVLFLSYYFPPVGGAGGQRNPRLVGHLADRGYEPVVITGPGEPNYRWAPLDASLAVPDVEVHRLAGPEPARGTGWGLRAERWLRRPSAWSRWWRAETLRAVRRVGAVDLVHASIAPYETAETALAVARELRAPLVVDFEDPWALDEMMIYPTALHRWLELRRMRRTLAAADHVVMNTRESANRVSELVPGARVTVVSNGFEAEDFLRGGPTRRQGPFRIVHTGSLHTDLGLAHRRRRRARRLLGGGVPGVDLLTRSHVYLLDALARMPEEKRARMELHLAGSLTDADEAALVGAPVRVHRYGFLPHDESLALVRSADLLFLPLHDVPPGRRVSIVPCKTYEYVASGRPILAAVPDGDARDILEAAGNAILCRPADVGAMVIAIERVLDGCAPRPHPIVAARYAYAQLAAELSRVYNATLAEVADAQAAPTGGLVAA